MAKVIMTGVGTGPHYPIGNTPYTYIAILNQSSTNDPVPTEITNTFHSKVTWTRLSTGFYLS